ncbi:probable ATP-dependent helicase lhr [Arthrobacter sp. Hiyo1]|uniref:DEAD/DEAH box helicase n=1 Tax=Arthrobacter sp. Hiyo1 TaxID=1588020 RepID=UPI0006A379C4|nr:probable ATP-dependent helicase lhr [Arthrobacter sp. Hiyo1]
MQEQKLPGGPGNSAMDRFSRATREWFLGAFSAPTPAQDGAWKAISSGSHALVVAPTGSGKTLAAFLWALDRLLSVSPLASADALPELEAQPPVPKLPSARPESCISRPSRPSAWTSNGTSARR